MNEISIQKLKDNDLLTQMRFFWCADKENFISAFKRLGLPIKSEADLITLKEWSELGIDKSGKLKTIKGDFLILDIQDFVNHNIKLRHNKLFNCNLKFVA